MKHKHHIIPKYMGGTDSQDNLVEVTITQHAMFHYCNFQLWGNEEDRIAWRGLSKLISHTQVIKESQIIAAKKRGIELRLKYFSDKKYQEEIYKRLMRIQRSGVEASKTPEARKRQKESFKRIGHQRGEKNSMYGTMWITDGTKEGSFRIKKGEQIPEGYRKGRII